MSDAIMKPFGLKAKLFAFRPPEFDARINILWGSVRSAKTWQMHPKLMQLSRYKVEGLRVIVGVTKQTIRDNVLNDLFAVVGPRSYHYNQQSGALELFGTQWLCLGAKDEGSEKFLRGKTIGIAYADEVTLLTKSFVMMLFNRMSPAGARFYGTTNPDSPFHYVKTDILDNVNMRAAGDIWSEKYTLDDNPNVEKSYKDFINRAYTGVFHQRFVQGLWVVAEGSIYKDCWNETELTYDDSTRPAGLLTRGGYCRHFVPCDYGTAHRHVYLDMYDDGETVWVEREYVWDSQAIMQKRLDSLGRVVVGPDESGVVGVSRQKTDKEYVDDLIEFLGPGGRDAEVIVPPEAASFAAELTLRGVWHRDADNDVTDGIRMVSSMMNLRRLRFHRGNCPNTIKRLPTYAWNPLAAKRGIEEPLKVNDDECDATRYGIKTMIPAWRLLS